LTALLETITEPENLRHRPQVPIVEPATAGIRTPEADGDGVLRVQIARQASSTQEADSPDSKADLKIPFASSEQGKREGRLRRSFEALGAVRSDRGAADWLEAATALKADAIRLRNSFAARHSAVLLAAADALTFTDPQDPALDSSSFESLERSLALLSEPFIAERAEEDFLVELIRTGWNLAPAVDLDSAPY
jgi:hypothetical protein